MSSDEGDDELKERANDLWELDEVRGGGDASTVEEVDSETSTSDTADSSDSSDTDDPGDTPEKPASDTADTPDASSKTDTQRGTGETDTETVRSDTVDTADTKDTTDSSPTDDSTDRGASRPPRGTVTDEDPTVRQLWRSAETEGVTVRDLHNVNVYLYEDIYDEMRRRFKQLDAEYLDVHGEDLSKNKAFFNAVFRAGLNSPELREELELD
jgi:hypothetical protein